jgi:CheY-like chemotaxis protein
LKLRADVSCIKHKKGRSSTAISLVRQFGNSSSFFLAADIGVGKIGQTRNGYCRLEGKLETRGHLAQPSAVAGGDSKRILVVDDDMLLTRLISEALRTRFQCEVDATPNPEYAFELALKKRYRVFVFDFSMPMIDGAMLFTLIGKVYNHVNPPLVVPPLILISGRGDEARAQELMKEIGVRGFLPKPFAMNRLLEKIKEIVPEFERGN